MVITVSGSCLLSLLCNTCLSLVCKDFLLFFFFKFTILFLNFILLAVAVLAVAQGPSVFFAVWRVLICSTQALICSMWDLVPWPRIKPRPPALEARSLSHWTTRGVPILCNSSPPGATPKKVVLPLHIPHGFGGQAGSLFSIPTLSRLCPYVVFAGLSREITFCHLLSKLMVPQFTHFSVSGVQYCSELNKAAGSRARWHPCPRSTSPVEAYLQ